MKQLVAFLAALVITAILAVGMLVIGVNAWVNPQTMPVANPSVVVDGMADAQTQIAQLKNLVAQYQSREQQYQAQINQLTTQNQQLQNVLTQLQRQGVIRILDNGTIQVQRDNREQRSR